MIFFGPVADIVPIEWLLIGSGLLIFALGLLISRNKSLVEAGQPTVQEGTAKETAACMMS
jgi:DHA3 family macrolide efflux protein-like MFS transporter